MPKGNARDPFCADGLDWDGNSKSNREFGIGRSRDGDDPADQWGQTDAADVDHINKRSNRNDHAEFEFKIGNEKTVLDKPVNASKERKGKGQLYYEGEDRWYTAGNGRKG